MSPLRTGTQEERTAATREKVLDATLASLHKHGYAGTSISTIVKLARVSRGAVLHHFDTKTDLVAASMVHLYQMRLAHFQEGDLERGRPRRRARGAFAHHARAH